MVSLSVYDKAFTGKTYTALPRQIYYYTNPFQEVLVSKL